MTMLGDFVRILRASDINVSTAETIEAGRVIGHIGLEDRQLMKTALSQVLAKSATDKAVFDDCFEAYFTKTPDHANDDEQSEDTLNAQQLGEAADSSVHSDELLDMLSGNDSGAQAAAMARAAATVNLADVRLFTQAGLFTRKIMDEMGLRQLETRLAQARREDEAELVEALEGARRRLFETVRDYVDQQIKMRTANAGRLVREEALSRIHLSHLDRSDMKIMRGLVEKMAKKLATVHSRRRKKAKRGVVDIRKTLRRNQRHDGLLIELMWRQEEVNRPRLITMCDISGSVAAYARFLLMFVYNLDVVIPRARSFVFSNQCGEISQLFEDMEIEEALAEAMMRYGGGSTDYGRSFQDLADAVMDDLDHQTTLMILGDGRSNFGDPGHEVLRDMAARCRRVIWLNPEPRPLWNTGDSEMQRLGAYCHHVQTCNTVRQLERVLDGLLRYH